MFDFVRDDRLGSTVRRRLHRGRGDNDATLCFLGDDVYPMETWNLKLSLAQRRPYIAIQAHARSAA
jgi:hypothetical protein